jgi:tetratricopeptide (TPR) repeat protein
MSADDEAAGGIADLGISLAMDDAMDGPEVDPSARRLIDKQAHLLDLQMETLTGQIRSIHIKHLREQLHAAFELLLAGAAALVVIVLLVMAIAASRANGVIIEPLASPPDLDRRGLTGAVVASRLLDRIGEIRDATSSVRAGGAARAWHAEDVKVEIPKTGLSLADLNRLLRGWLGHETAVTGEIFHDRGQLSVAVRVGDRPGVTVSGPEDQIDALIDRAAEAVIAQTEPYRYAVYLSTQGRRDEALAQARQLASAPTGQDRAWGYAMWGRLLASQGDFAGALAMGRRALELNPNLSATYDNLAAAQRFLGHDQEAGAEDARALALMRNQAASLDPVTGPIRLATTQGRVLESEADYTKAITAYRKALALGGAEHAAVAAASLPRALARQHNIFAAQAQLREMPPTPPEDAVADAALAPAEVALAMEDWPAAVGALRAADAAAERFGPAGQQFRRTAIWPRLAYALARSGDMAGAQALIVQTPPDCYLCAVTAAQLAVMQGKPDEAQARFQMAVALAPDLAAAYLEWGRALLVAGDAKGAAARFETAAAKAPGWADPQLAAGLVLLAQGQTQAATSRLRKAVALAPHWGAARQALGEALSRTGHAGEAVEQFTQAKIAYRPSRPPPPIVAPASGKLNPLPPPKSGVRP